MDSDQSSGVIGSGEAFLRMYFPKEYERRRAEKCCTKCGQPLPKRKPFAFQNPTRLPR